MPRTLTKSRRLSTYVDNEAAILAKIASWFFLGQSTTTSKSMQRIVYIKLVPIAVSVSLR